MPQSSSARFSSMRMDKFKMESKQLRSGTERGEGSKVSKAAIKKPKSVKKSVKSTS